MFTNEIINRKEELLQEVKDYEVALRALRCSRADWKDGLEKDERPAVKSLYKTYTEALNKYNSFMDNSWELKSHDIEIDFDKYYTSEEILSLLMNRKIPNHRKVDACYQNHKPFGVGFYTVGNSCYYIYENNNEKEEQAYLDFFRMGYLFKITHEVVEN